MNEKIIGIKKAVRKFNRWHGFARIYYNPVNNFVWTKVYLNGAEHEEFSNPEIVEVYSKTTFLEKDLIITPNKLESLITEISKSKVGAY